MASDQTSVRIPWIALTLSFLASGVGHIYCGRIVRGLFLYSARFFLPLLCIIAVFAQPSTGVLLGLILAPAAATLILFLYSAVDAYSIARRTAPDYLLKEYNRASLYGLLVAMQLAYPVALTLGIRTYAYEAFFIPTRSMSPNFLIGDRILVNKRPFQNGSPERGDVIVFRSPPSEGGHIWIKRVIGVAGDRIVIHGREIEVNGQKLEREPVPKESLAEIMNQIEGEVHLEKSGRRYRVLLSEDQEGDFLREETDITVPDRSLFVIGDDRDRSKDSRMIGPIPVDQVIGHVDYIFFPAETWSRFGVYRDEQLSR